MGGQEYLGLGRPGPFIYNSMLRASFQNGSWRVIEKLLKICKQQSLRPFLCKHFNQVWFGQDPSSTASRALAPGQASPDSTGGGEKRSRLAPWQRRVFWFWELLSQNVGSRFLS